MKIDISKIDTTQKYDGYLWYSDKEKPEVFESKELGKFLKDDGSFIVEGNLYAGGHSYSIRFIDGEYIVSQFDVAETDFNNKDIVDKYYLSNKMDNRQLHFLQYWKEIEDENCHGRKVLQPAELVFVGFDKAPKKEGK